MIEKKNIPKKTKIIDKIEAKLYLAHENTKITLKQTHKKWKAFNKISNNMQLFRKKCKKFH